MRGRSVLVVEDSPDVAALMVEVLEDAGWSVIVTAQAADAVDAAKRLSPDVVLFDDKIGQTSAYDLYQMLVNEGDQSLAVLCSGSNSAVEVAADLGLPFLQQPFDIDELVRVVEAAASSE